MSLVIFFVLFVVVKVCLLNELGLDGNFYYICINFVF